MTTNGGSLGSSVDDGGGRTSLHPSAYDRVRRDSSPTRGSTSPRADAATSRRIVPPAAGSSGFHALAHGALASAIGTAENKPPHCPVFQRHRHQRRRNGVRTGSGSCPPRAHIRPGLRANGKDSRHHAGGSEPLNYAGFSPNRIEKDQTLLGSNPTVSRCGCRGTGERGCVHQCVNLARTFAVSRDIPRYPV